MDFKDKINDVIKEGNVDHIADILKSEQDKEWLKHGGPFGHSLFGNINSNAHNHNDDNNIGQIPTVTEEDIQFVLEVMSKEAPHDKTSIKQLFYGMCSAFTKTGIPHNVNSKDPGAGKNYLLDLVAKYFPDRYVEQLVGASDKAFLHKRGKSVIKDKDTGELKDADPIIEQLEEEIEELQLQIQIERNKGNDDSTKNKDLIKENNVKIKEKNKGIKINSKVCSETHQF